MNINFENIKSIKLSLMKKESEIDKDNKALYESYASCTFNIPVNFFNDLNNEDPENLCVGLLEALYNDLMNEVEHNGKDYLGIWINYNENKYDNAIEIKALDNMETFGDKNISPIYEFFKMSIR